MKSHFQTDLICKTITDNVSEVYEEFIYYSRVIQSCIIIPRKFQTDFASIKRIPFIYLLFANVAKKAATIHDFLYRKDNGLNISRRQADRIFLNAMKITKVNFWRRYLIYFAVRLFGKKFYKQKRVFEEIKK